MKSIMRNQHEDRINKLAYCKRHQPKFWHFTYNWTKPQGIAMIKLAQWSDLCENNNQKEGDGR